MTYSTIAREYLLQEGLSPDLVIKTGSPMFEVLNYYQEKIDSSKILSKLKLKSGQYFLVSAHREENIDSEINFGNLVDTLIALLSNINYNNCLYTPKNQKTN